MPSTRYSQQQLTGTSEIPWFSHTLSMSRARITLLPTFLVNCQHTQVKKIGDWGQSLLHHEDSMALKWRASNSSLFFFFLKTAQLTLTPAPLHEPSKLYPAARCCSPAGCEGIPELGQVWEELISSLGHTHPRVREAHVMLCCCSLPLSLARSPTMLLLSFRWARGARALQPPACKRIRDMDKCCRHQ